MVELRGVGRAICLVVLFFILQSCAQTKNGPQPATTVQGPQETTVEEPSQIEPTVPVDNNQKTVQARKAASLHAPSQIKPPVALGDYQKTINYYKKEYRKRPQDQELVKEYVKTVKEIKTAADEASRREDLASACKTYNILMKNYWDFKGFANALSFDAAQLKAKVTTCKTDLSKKGFQEYREGKLGEAIALWQGCLAIDPNDADIKKALNTAKAQQKNLQQTK